MLLVTFDLDSTLADTRHRHHMIAEDKVSTDWRAYSKACANDSVILPAVVLLRMLQNNRFVRIAIISGRDEAARLETEKWLADNGIECDLLLLNGHTTHYDTHEDYKIGRIREACETLAAVHVLHVDDWPPVAKALTAQGFNCICPASPQHLDNFNTDGHLTFV
jgi:predicted TIM-barrel fold metal-dependent hydrolase